MRKVLYLSLKEFRSAQKRQLDDGTPNSNGKFTLVLNVRGSGPAVRLILPLPFSHSYNVVKRLFFFAAQTSAAETSARLRARFRWDEMNCVSQSVA